MVEHIESALINKGFALGVFLDIQEAIDNVNPNSILLGKVEKVLSQPELPGMITTSIIGVWWLNTGEFFSLQYIKS